VGSSLPSQLEGCTAGLYAWGATKTEACICGAGWVEALEEILHNSRAPQILRQPDGTYLFAVQVRRTASLAGLMLITGPARNTLCPSASIWRQCRPLLSLWDMSQSAAHAFQAGLAYIASLAGRRFAFLCAARRACWAPVRVVTGSGQRNCITHAAAGIRILAHVLVTCVSLVHCAVDSPAEVMISNVPNDCRCRGRGCDSPWIRSQA